MMSSIQSKSILLASIVTLLGLGGCGTAPGDRATVPSPQSSPSVQSSPAAQAPASPSASASPFDANPRATNPFPTSESTVPVTIYKSDSQCVNFEAEQIQVPSDRSIEAAVGQVIDQQTNADFALSGYRVSVNSGIATVDFRLAPDSKRTITSLSACEQFALFGSLQRTLTENKQWNVREVKFTERGQDIAL